MSGEKMPDWYENFPFKKGEKKKPVKISGKDEIVTTYGIDGNDIISKVLLSTEDLNTSDFSCPPGGFLIPPGMHCNEEIYYIVRGEALILNPENGQAVKIKQGDSVLIPRGTLHQVFNFGKEELYVLCFIHKQWGDKEWKKLENMVRNKK